MTAARGGPYHPKGIRITARVLRCTHPVGQSQGFHSRMPLTLQIIKSVSSQTSYRRWLVCANNLDNPPMCFKSSLSYLM